MIKIRNPVYVLYMSLVTLGLYELHWLYQTRNELNRFGAQIPRFWSILIPGYNFYFLYKYSEAYSTHIKQDNKILRRFLFSLVFLQIPLLNSVGVMLIQVGLNRFARERQGPVKHKGLLALKNLGKHFEVGGGAFQRSKAWLKAVDGITLEIEEGQTYGLVGESGCGKTTTAKLILLLEIPTGGQVLFNQHDVNYLDRRGLKNYKGSVQAVFQDPWASLNPRMRVGAIISEPLEVNSNMTSRQVRTRVTELLEEVGLQPYQANLFPHEFSGGQRQRIGVARALALNPKVIVLDEPVSALDVSIRAQIMNLLQDLQAEHNLSYLLIAHHLATVRYLCDKVGVMYLGRIVEEAETEELFENPLHPYTRALMSAALPSHPDIEREEIILTGEVPSPVDPPSGCHFHPRCPSRFEPCADVEPQLTEPTRGHKVVCHLYPS